MSNEQRIVPVDPEELPVLPGFHQVMTARSGTSVYIAGQVAMDKDFVVSGLGDYRAQTVKALQNVALAASAAGGSADDVVKSTIFVRDLQPDMVAGILESMAVALDGDPFPAHAFSVIGVQALAHPDILIEIEAVAVVE